VIDSFFFCFLRLGTLVISFRSAEDGSATLIEQDSLDLEIGLYFPAIPFLLFLCTSRPCAGRDLFLDFQGLLRVIERN